MDILFRISYSHYREWWPQSRDQWDGQGIQLFPESKFVFFLVSSPSTSSLRLRGDLIIICPYQVSFADLVTDCGYINIVLQTTMLLETVRKKKPVAELVSSTWPASIS